MKRSDIPVLEVLRAVEQKQAESAAAVKRAGGIRAAMTDLATFRGLRDVPGHLPQYPRKVVMARVMQLVDKGLLDYGVCPEQAFLTDKGRLELTLAKISAAH